MPATSELSTMAEHLKLRGPRRPNPILASDPRNPHPNIPPSTQSTTCKSTISSLLLSTFTNSSSHSPESGGAGRGSGQGGKRGFRRNSGLRGFGCTAQPEVAVPAPASAPAAAIRVSADWKGRGEKKSRKKKNQQRGKEREGLMEVQDVWCGPGIGFCSDDFVASTRPVGSRGKIDVDEIHQRERPAYTARQRATVDTYPDPDGDSPLENPRFGSDVFEARYYHHLRNRSPEGLSEIMMFQSRIFMGARSYGLDRYRELRLDTENMSYEELLELGDRIGYVNTGLKEDQMGHCIRKTKLMSSLDDESHFATESDRKCIICQEEYETDDETGRLECRHMYHVDCIKQWLTRKNACPICKAEASSY